MEFKEEDIKLEVEEEILLDQVVEVVPCPGKRILYLLLLVLRRNKYRYLALAMAGPRCFDSVPIGSFHFD